MSNVIRLAECDGPVRGGVAKRKPAIEPTPVQSTEHLKAMIAGSVLTLQGAWAADHLSERNLAELLAVIRHAARCVLATT